MIQMKTQNLLILMDNNFFYYMGFINPSNGEIFCINHRVQRVFFNLKSR